MKDSLSNAPENQFMLSCKKSTLSSFNSLSLCHPDGSLTEEGNILAIYILPLKKQAVSLNLPLTEIDLNYNKCPETELRNFLIEKSGFKEVCFAEGGDMRILLSCMCFDLIQEVWRTHWRTHPSTIDYYDTFGESAVESSVQSYTYHDPIGSLTELISYENNPEFRSGLIEKILNRISTATLNDIEIAYTTLKKWQNEMGWADNVWPWQSYLGLNLRFLLNLFEIIGSKNLTKIAESYFIEPLAFHKGWPDLSVINDTIELQLIEVKSSDKLNLSQIITISEMRKYFNISLFKVRKQRTNSIT